VLPQAVVIDGEQTGVGKPTPETHFRIRKLSRFKRHFEPMRPAPPDGGVKYLRSRRINGSSFPHQTIQTIITARLAD